MEPRVWMQKEKDKLENEINEIQKRLKYAPKGGLQIAVHGDKRYYYQVFNPQERKKIDKYFALKLAQKHKDNARLKECEAELQAIDQYLKTYESQKPSARKESVGLRELLTELDQKAPLDLSDWEYGEYEKSTYPIKFPHTTKKEGEFVRSKAEAMIAIYLYINHIPYHYEEILWINGRKYCPDFTIRHPITGETFYWEHFGLMDKEDYTDRCRRKIYAYMMNGFVPGRNMIFTFESAKVPLDADSIMRVIQRYFLS